MSRQVEEMSSSSIDVKFKRADRIYHPNDRVEGTVVINAFKGWSHQGVRMQIDGAVLTNTSNTGIGIIDNLASSLRPVVILKEEISIATPGNFPNGTIEIPFQFALTGNAGQPLLESYHGVFINVISAIRVTCDRGVMKKSLFREVEFIVEIPSKKPMDTAGGDFEISPDVLEHSGGLDPSQFPHFKITGKVHRYNCPITMPFTGELVIESSDVAIRTIELQLVRLETLASDGSSPTKEATEVQIIQIGDGDVCRNLAIPMYMVFPRLYSCPTLISSAFKVEFEVNLVISFVNGFTVTENFPIKLFRDS